jgi:aspartyl-tRNA(Asn)/glutamyl-tRNA(Gln) amidotransferase subunit A
MMDATDLAFVSLDDLAALLRAHELSPVEVTEVILKRTEQLEPILSAYITFTAELALDDARRAEQEIMAGAYRGPLHGVPIAIKDWLWTKGVRTTMGSRVLSDFVPDEDAAAVARLRQAGAVILGKTQSAELGFGEHLYGFPRNPWDTSRHPGSSSTGSAIVLAAGLAYGALGTDTAGSIRWPAAWCGVTGLKPSKGCISLHGVIPFSERLDHVGPMARSVLDCAHLLDVLAGFDPRDQLSLEVPRPPRGWAASLPASTRPLRIGVPRAYFWGELLEADVRSAAQAALSVWRDLGWMIQEVELPSLEPVIAACEVVNGVETARALDSLLSERVLQTSRRFQELMDWGRGIAAEDYHAALEICVGFAASLDAVFGAVDVLVTPTRAGTSREIGEHGWPVETPPEGFRALFNHPGVPAISVPCGFDRGGLPIGVQIIGPRLRDDLPLAAGHAFQLATDWHRCHPPLDQDAGTTPSTR